MYFLTIIKSPKITDYSRKRFSNQIMDFLLCILYLEVCVGAKYLYDFRFDLTWSTPLLDI